MYDLAGLHLSVRNSKLLIRLTKDDCVPAGYYGEV
jgi:hypothetical protein